MNHHNYDLFLGTTKAESVGKASRIERDYGEASGDNRSGKCGAGSC